VIGTPAFIALGANLGEPRAAVQEAMAEIDQLPGTRVRARSALYRSAPVDAGGPDYVNAVVEVQTTLGPLPLLRALLALEQQHGRRRGVRNAPRTLDLDLLLWGDVVMDTPELTLPHPRLHQRAFVLRPLAQIAPALVLPGRGPLAPWLAAAAEQVVEEIAA
jgi:2-amino-4-hydroxy-6-hydroxymethyldihydropteridine diphosphokinase